MSDITMCISLNNECPSKEKCYRYKAEPNPQWQSYSDFVTLYLLDDDEKCKWFWDMKDRH